MDFLDISSMANVVNPIVSCSEVLRAIKKGSSVLCTAEVSMREVRQIIYSSAQAMNTPRRHDESARERGSSVLCETSSSSLESWVAWSYKVGRDLRRYQCSICPRSRLQLLISKVRLLSLEIFQEFSPMSTSSGAATTASRLGQPDLAIGTLNYFVEVNNPTFRTEP